MSHHTSGVSGSVLAGPRAAGFVAAAGCALLLARPLAWHHLDHPVGALVALFGGLLVVGWAWPRRAARAHVDALVVIQVIAVGGAAFAIARMVGAGAAPGALTLRFVALNSLAAVAEEAFFRGAVYDLVARRGPMLAVAGSALAFALVHVTVYGSWVLPIDLAAGLLFGWQRHATSSWWPAACTHVLANILVVI